MNWGQTPKKHFWVMTFQLSLPYGMRSRLIERNGALLAVLKR
jgi:hypothetical protein